MDDQSPKHGESMSLDTLFKESQIFRKELTEFRKEQTIKNDELSECLAKLEPRDCEERRERDESSHSYLRIEQKDRDKDESHPRNREVALGIIESIEIGRMTLPIRLRQKPLLLMVPMTLRFSLTSYQTWITTQSSITYQKSVEFSLLE